MTDFMFTLNKNITGRVASQLTWDLNNITGNIRIINTEGRMVNGKSLLGLLSARLQENDTIKVMIDRPEDEGLLKAVFNKIATIK